MSSLYRKFMIPVVVLLMLVAAVMPVSGGASSIGLNAQTVGCTIVIDFIMPAPLIVRLDGKSFAKFAAGTIVSNIVYVNIFDDGTLLASFMVSGDIGQPQQVIYTVDRYYDNEDIGIYVDTDGTGFGYTYNAIDPYDVPNSVYDSCQGEAIPTVASPACPYPLSPTTLGQGRVIFPTQVFWDASYDTLTDVVLPVGTSWWIIEARDGFYKLFVACQAQYVWVPAEALGANFDVVWGGRPLPPAGNLPE
jgi:hypothetical protein